MKQKTKRILQLAAVSAAFISLVSCRKNIEGGQLIQADGTVTDITSQDPFAGVTVYLYGGTINSSNGTPLYGNGPYDSTVTDAAGHFSIRYRAEGKSVDYALSLNNTHSDGNLYLPYDFAGPFLIPFDYQHQLRNAAFTVSRAYDLRLHLSIASNPYDSLSVIIGSNYGISSYYYVLRGQSVDTLLPAKFVPGNVKYVIYRPYNADTLIDGVNYHRELTDTLQFTTAGAVDTEKHIVSTNNFPLHIY